MSLCNNNNNKIDYSVRNASQRCITVVQPLQNEGRNQ